jgi:hypothetical protein
MQRERARAVLETRNANISNDSTPSSTAPPAASSSSSSSVSSSSSSSAAAAAAAVAPYSSLSSSFPSSSSSSSFTSSAPAAGGTRHLSLSSSFPASASSSSSTSSGASAAAAAAALRSSFPSSAVASLSSSSSSLPSSSSSSSSSSSFPSSYNLVSSHKRYSSDQINSVSMKVPRLSSSAAQNEVEYDFDLSASEKMASFEAPPAVWNNLFSSSSSSRALTIDEEIQCTDWAIRHLAFSLNTSNELSAWSLLVHSGIYSRARLHLKLLLEAAASSSLDSLPSADLRSLILIDSLSWNPADDDMLLNGSQDNLRACRGSAEVELRIQFLTSDNE